MPYSSSLLTSPLLTLWILASSVFDYADRILHCASVHPICDSVTMSSINDKFFHPLLFYFIFLVYKSLLTKWFYCMFRRHYLKFPSWICWYNFVFYNSSVILIVTLLQFVNGCNWDKLAFYVTFPQSCCSFSISRIKIQEVITIYLIQNFHLLNWWE